MELRHLRSFVAIAEEMNFTRAAQHLHISQPPLTRMIQDLEKELGVQLFDRSKRQIALTPAGKAFLEQANGILKQCDEAVSMTLRVSRGEVGQLKIGFTGTALHSGLPEIVHSYGERFPGVEVRLLELALPAQWQRLSEHQIDVGFAVAPGQKEGMTNEVVLKRTTVVVLPAKHPLATQKTIDLSLLTAEPWIWFPRQCNPCYHDHNLQLCRQAGFEPRIVQETNQAHVMVSLVAAGIGVALMSGFVQGLQQRDVIYKPLNIPTPPLELCMLWRAQETSPLALSFLQIVREKSPRWNKRYNAS
ncbi:MAG: LysR family transcriptional regulator [Chloroflexota bacterium]|nr:LysR family transcriptional regulator [Chloroflexota bacterium]